MRLLSWIFQPVYLIFFAIIAALYIYRAEIIPEHRDVEQSKELTAHMEQVARSIEDEHRAVNASLTNREQKRDAEPVVKQEVELLSEPEQQFTEVAVEQVKVEPQTESPSDFNVQLPSADGDALAIEETAITSAVEQPDVLNIPMDDSPPQPLGELWYAARKSAMGDDINQAIASYIHLTSLYPQHADGFGELGNLYYAQGNLERAITAYQQALKIYQNLGASGESMQLQKIIDGLSEKNN